MKPNSTFRLIPTIAALLLLVTVAGYLLVKNSANPAPSYNGSPPVTAGIGIMGDSLSDEYRADDARGGIYGPTTLNWVEQLSISRRLNFGPWGTWGEPRRTGYEYNWARSAARAGTMIATGQHTGLARQVAEGKVSIVVLWIGNNDFHPTNGTYEEIYNGTLNDQQLQEKLDQVLDDITTAMDTVLDAGPVQMIVMDIGDKSLDPATRKLYPDDAKLQRVTDAIKEVNAGIKALALDRGVVFVDTNRVGLSVLTRIDLNGYLHVGDQKINFLTRGDDPHHMQLDDFSGHPGTVASGLVANMVFIEPLADNFGIIIPPLTDEEILVNAGIN
jgi:hypothetical protein